MLRAVIPDRRNFERMRRLAFGLLTTPGRHTITAMIEATGRADRDWSADYRLFSRGDWNPQDLFRSLLPSILALQPNHQDPVIASLDDTHLKKTGRKIPGVSYKRDPMSPPFHVNLIRAQRFVHATLVVPFHPGASGCRAIPVAFDHAPSVPKPGARASSEEIARYRQQQKQQNLSVYGATTMRRLRDDLDQAGASEQTLLIGADGGYTNKTILTRLAPRTEFIGRIRKDAVLHSLPDAHSGLGRPRSYGAQTPTPEAFRQDDSIPWTTVKIFAAGREHDCEVKDIGPLLWRKAGCELPLRLIVIRPLGYKLTKNGRVLYRQPAYLITTALTRDLAVLIQAYVWRWEIEVNHRDEKQLIGVGQAQVRSEKSAERVPAFAVLCYSTLLLAAAHAFGIGATLPITPLPKWLLRSAKQQVRIPTSQIVTGLRNEFLSSALKPDLPSFSHFARQIERHKKWPKGVLSTADAIQFAMN